MSMETNFKQTTKQTRGVHRTHTPHGTSTGYSAATIDVTSLPIASNKCYRVYCVRVWPYPKCGSDRLPYIQQHAYCEVEEVGPNVTNNRK